LSATAAYLRRAEDFARTAARYRAKRKTCAVIIIDSTDEIAEDDPRLLRMLQREAKMAADNSLYKTIFVTSGGGAFERMKSGLRQASAYRSVLITRADRSGWSGGRDTCRIGDLTASEAMKHLEKRRISQQHARQTHPQLWHPNLVLGVRLRPDQERG